MSYPSTEMYDNHFLTVRPSQTRRTVDLVNLQTNKDIVLHHDRKQTKYRHKCTNNYQCLVKGIGDWTHSRLLRDTLPGYIWAHSLGYLNKL
ncbi:hypothetical protein HanPSC8_Chr02g0046511 [Helianthus annuus]|nr:hypothetical protein HanPSC8_Chr02g0046511 [Helianthus annuus]